LGFAVAALGFAVAALGFDVAALGFAVVALGFGVRRTAFGDAVGIPAVDFRGAGSRLLATVMDAP
jgi:hypothetical protein